MSYKLKSLLYLFSFIVSSIVYQNYDDTLTKTGKDLNSSQLARVVKEHDTITVTPQVGMADFVKEE